MEDKEVDVATAKPEAVSRMTYSVLTFRKLPEQYTGLVYSRWLKSLRYGNEYFKLIDNDVYFHVYHDYLTLLLNREGVEINIAVLSDDVDVVLGFSVKEAGVLHFVHVHKDQRKRGVGRTLAGQFTHFTHITTIAAQIWNSKYPNAKFNPFI